MKELHSALPDESNILSKEKEIMQEPANHLNSKLTNANDQLHAMQKH